MKETVWKSMVIILALMITYFSIDILHAISFPFEILPDNAYLSNFLLRLLDNSILLMAGVVLFWRQLPALLGVHHSLIKSFGVAFLSVLPMLLIFPFVFEVSKEASLKLAYQQAIIPAIFEEVAYRALVVGVLFKLCHWKFLPAVLLNALVFGMGHLYQASDLLGAFFTFAITFIGAVWFGWLYVKWGYNLYIPVFLHLLMNLSWIVFEVSPGAAGNTLANVARLLTIIVSVVITLYYTGQAKTLSWNKMKVTPNT